MCFTFRLVSFVCSGTACSGLSRSPSLLFCFLCGVLRPAPYLAACHSSRFLSALRGVVLIAACPVFLLFSFCLPFAFSPLLLRRASFVLLFLSSFWCSLPPPASCCLFFSSVSLSLLSALCPPVSLPLFVSPFSVLFSFPGFVSSSLPFFFSRGRKRPRRGRRGGLCPRFSFSYAEVFLPVFGRLFSDNSVRRIHRRILVCIW